VAQAFMRQHAGDVGIRRKLARQQIDHTTVVKPFRDPERTA
jgi:hypothetical protein